MVDSEKRFIEAAVLARKPRGCSDAVHYITSIDLPAPKARAVLIQLASLVFAENTNKSLEKKEVVLTSWGLLTPYSSEQSIGARRSQYILYTGYNGEEPPSLDFLHSGLSAKEIEKEISRRSDCLTQYEKRLYSVIYNYFSDAFQTQDDKQKLVDTAIANWISEETGEVMLPSRSNYTIAPSDTIKPSAPDDTPPDPQPNSQPEPQPESPSAESPSREPHPEPPSPDPSSSTLVKPQPDPPPIAKGLKKPTRRVVVALLAVGILVAAILATILLLPHEEPEEEAMFPLTADEFERLMANEEETQYVPPIDTMKFVSVESEENYGITNQWGDSDDGRQMYTTDEINKGVLGNTVTFNSILDSAVGNEGKFVGAKIADSSDNTWINDYVDVRHGETYTICLYVHNDNPGGLDAVSDDTSISFSLPETVGTSLTAHGYISSSNATPDYYEDTVTFRSDEAFSLEYVEGSARFTNEKMKAISLSDEQIFNGHPIGYDRFDGKIPGGDKYIGVAMIDVVIKSSRSYELLVSARLEGTKARNYRTMDANVGDVIEYVIEYQNLRNTPVQNISITDELSINAEYIKGSTVVYDYYHQDGVPDKTDSIVTQDGLNIGDYDTGGNALIIFKARIVDNTLGEGKNLVSNFVKLCNEEYADPSAIHADDEVTVYVRK